MSDRYPFIGDKTLVTHNVERTIVWNEQMAVQPSLDFSNVSNNTLSDTLSESYVTAIEDNNETQYLSVLETTNDITLDSFGHNLTLENAKLDQQENLEFNNEGLENAASDVNNSQVVLFNLEGSDDLYGIQFAQDDAGNMQKYQFKFRSTEDGQLEAIPESIQLLPDDDEVVSQVSAEENEGIFLQEPEENAETELVLQSEFENEIEEIVEEEQIQQVEEDEGSLKIFVKGEQHLEEDVEQEIENADDNIINRLSINEDINFEEDGTLDVKKNIFQKDLLLSNKAAIIKEELFQESSPGTTEKHIEIEYDVYNTGATNSENFHQTYEANAELEEQEAGSLHNIEYEHYSPEGAEIEEQAQSIDNEVFKEESEHYERLFVQEYHMEDANNDQAEETEEILEERFIETGLQEDSDNDDYQIVEGLHVTGDLDNQPDQQPETQTILQEVMKKPLDQTLNSILKQPVVRNVQKTTKAKNKTIVYYVVPRPEKENVNSLSNKGNLKKNPRSILKSSFSPVQKTEVQTNKILDERLNKRFARSKEAVQARIFNNFISKTTIPTAPVRNTRLPRKQQIKPVDNRRDEEIIVQEVMVSSHGFIENVMGPLKNKDKFEITEYVELSDSDDDYHPKQGDKKKKKLKKIKKIESAASADESDSSVIEILHSDEEEDSPSKPKQGGLTKRGRGRPRKSLCLEPSEKTETTKRRRGRPPKFGHPFNSDSEDVPLKKSRTESEKSEAEESGESKREIKCPHCVKTFPSENSLSTHIQHHNLENRLRYRRGKMDLSTVKFEYKHKCASCNEIFKNSILLTRHKCEKQTKKKQFECSICKKVFLDVSVLEIHRRSHTKANLFKSTNVTQISPRKFLSRPSTSLTKSPKKFAVPKFTVPKVTFKCLDCLKVFSSQESLKAHEKNHKKFSCTSCGANFTSKLLLDTHVRVSCVKKLASPLTRRLSLRIKRSFVCSPMAKRTSGFAGKSTISKLGRASSAFKERTTIKVKCDQCDLELPASSLFKHKVKEHGMETPNRDLILKDPKTIHKPLTLFGGIPAQGKLKNAFSGMKGQIKVNTPRKKSTN